MFTFLNRIAHYELIKNYWHIYMWNIIKTFLYLIKIYSTCALLLMGHSSIKGWKQKDFSTEQRMAAQLNIIFSSDSWLWWDYTPFPILLHPLLVKLGRLTMSSPTSYLHNRIPISLNMAANDTEELLHCCWLVTGVRSYICFCYVNRENNHVSACKACESRRQPLRVRWETSQSFSLRNGPFGESDFSLLHSV